MDSKKTILLPTDFSESARNAMKYGLQLYKGRGHKFVVLNTVEPAAATSSAGMIVNMNELMANDSLEGLKKNKKWLESLPESEGSEIESIQMFGEFVSCLKHIIKEKSIDMVIMGTTGASGLKEFFVGSNAASVIQDIAIPTLTVPFNANFGGIRRIAFATDLKPYKSHKFLRFVKEIAIKREARLTILNVTKSVSKIKPADKETAKANFMSYFEGANVDYGTYSNEDTVEGIQGYIRDNGDVDLLVMVPRRKNFFEKIFSKSVAKKVAYHSTVPMLTLQEH